ncbi:MAG: PAS domain-containing protein [Holophagales bacterium]|nr:MAG: PAS domain-containing protein [Holophagales bacterium]
MPVQHRLLRRQLLRQLGTEEPPAGHEALFAAIDEAYQQADRDRGMLERSLDLSSEELMQANADLRAVFRAVPDLFLWLDEHGRVLDESGGSKPIRAAWPGPLVGQSVAGTREPRIGRLLTEALAEVATTRKLVSVEYSVVDDDIERIFEARLFPLLERQKLAVVREVTGLRMMERALRRSQEELEQRVAQRTVELSAANAELEREIAERRRAERVAEDAQLRLQRFIEALPAVTYLAEAGPRGQWHYASPQIERLTGAPSAEFLADSGLWRRMVHPEDRDRFTTEEARLLTGGAFLMEYRLLTRDGRIVWVRDQAIAAREGPDDDARVLFQGVVLDVTDRKVLEQQLVQAQKMEAVGRLAGGVAHDFNNMLTAIGGYAELLARQLPPDSTWAKQVAEIRRASGRAAELTAKLLAFGRRQILRPRTIDLRRLVADLEPMLDRLLGEEVELQVLAPTQPAIVRADPGQIEQVLVNLAVNARDAMPGGGTLTVRIGQSTLPARALEPEVAERSLPAGDYVTIEVADTGIGLSDEVRAHLFEPFFTTKPVGHGTGLGLATVHGIVRQSGGDVLADSSPGQGAVFTVMLPRAASDGHEAPVVAAPPPPPPPRGAETVLLAEDESTVRDLLSALLVGLGYRVLAAANGAEALAVAERHGLGSIDALVTDVVMPGLGGRELAERLRAVRPSLPVLFCSGYAERPPETAGDVRTIFLSKPFSPTDLAIRLRTLLDDPSA